MAARTRARRLSGREWLLRATTGSSALVREFVALDEGVRRPLPGTCVVGVVQAAGGAGTTTLTAALGVLLATRRRSAVLAVDAAAGEASLARAAGVADPIELAAGVGIEGGDPEHAVRASLPTSPTGLAVLGTGTSGGYRRPVTPAGWASAVAPIADSYEVVLTDWGVRGDPDTDPNPDADDDARDDADDEVDAIARSHDVCVVVARADREAAGRCLPLVQAISRNTDVVLALVDIGGTARPPWGTLQMVELTWADRMLELGLRVPVIAVPHDAVAGRAGLVDHDRVPTAVRLAWDRVAAATLELAGGGA